MEGSTTTNVVARSFRINPIETNLQELKKLSPLVTFVEPDTIECPNTWHLDKYGVSDDQDVQIIHGDLMDKLNIRLAGELAVAQFNHRNDADFDRLFFFDVERHLWLLHEHEWLTFVDYNTVRLPVGWKTDNVRGRTLVRDDKGRFRANYYRGAESLDILKVQDM